MTANNDFFFNNSLILTEEDYVSIYKLNIDSESPKYNLIFFIKLFIAVVITGLSFLTVYTSTIGIIIILLYLSIFFEQKLLPFVSKFRYRNRKYLKDNITYSISSKEITFKSKTIDVKTTWNSFYNWHKRGNWLILTFYDSPTAYLPIDKLKDSNVYDQVMNLARKYGKEYK